MNPIIIMLKQASKCVNLVGVRINPTLSRRVFTMNPSMPTTLTPDYESVKKHLRELRDNLLRLHKALVDSERVEYEKTVGQIASPHHFLQLLTGDPWFAWLSPLSQLIVAIDESLDAKEPPPLTDLEALVSQSYQLLVPAETGGDNPGFARPYFDALQRDPDVVGAHADLAQLRRARQGKS
jgi:hypothetical protein